MQNNNSDESNNAQPSTGIMGFFQRVMDFFLGGNDPEREKRKILKDIARNLKKNKFKFYKPSNETALPGFANFFFELYKTLGPAQLLLQNAGESGVLRTIVIDRNLSEKHQQLQDRLREERIREDAKRMDLKKLSGELKECLVELFSAFDLEIAGKINATYNQLLYLMDFINFDYHFLLKKFDSTLPSNGFNYSPRFEPINGEYIVDDVKDFLEIIPKIDVHADWNKVLDILKDYKGVEVIQRQALKKLLGRIHEIRKSRVFEEIVMHVTKDPFYESMVKTHDEKIVESYLTKLRTHTELVLQKIIQERRKGKLDQLAKAVFGTTAVSRLKHYTEKANVAFSKKMLGGYVYVEPLNYLKAFLLDYFKNDIRKLVNPLLVQGQWTANIMSQQLSEAFYQLMEISEELVKFDESVAEEGELGHKVKATLLKIDRDKTAMNILRSILKSINEKALEIINESAQNLIVVGKNLKLLIDDRKKQHPEVMMNWRELEAHFDGDLMDEMNKCYKTLYHFIQLEKTLVKRK